jgi:magnesium transporter
MKKRSKMVLANDATESTGLLLRLRLPVLVIGLIGGIGTSFLLSRYEDVLAQNVAIAFFVPLMVYIAGAMATQTETIYVRNLKKKNAKGLFWKYLFKEASLGAIIGVIFGTVTGVVSLIWLGQPKVSITISVAMALAIAAAPVVALCIANLLYRFHEDPAVGAGPFATLVGDVVTLLIYFAVASLVLL